MVNSDTDIVVGTDGSPKAMKAVRWAAEEAGRRGCALRVVGVQHSLGSPVSVTSGRSHLHRYEQFLDAARVEVSASHPGLVVRTAIRDGDTVKELVAESSDAAAVVIGSRGRGGFSGLLVGSTSLRMTSRAYGPVIVVPDVPDTQRSGVVVGDDGSEKSAEALTFAFEQARLRGDSLTVVRVVANAYWYGPDGAYGEWLKASIRTPRWHCPSGSRPGVRPTPRSSSRPPCSGVIPPRCSVARPITQNSSSWVRRVGAGQRRCYSGRSVTTCCTTRRARSRSCRQRVPVGSE